MEGNLLLFKKMNIFLILLTDFLTNNQIDLLYKFTAYFSYERLKYKKRDLIKGLLMCQSITLEYGISL